MRQSRIFHDIRITGTQLHAVSGVIFEYCNSAGSRGHAPAQRSTDPKGITHILDQSCLMGIRMAFAMA